MKNSWKKTFYIIFAGQAFSVIGSAAVQFSIIWYLTQLTGSATTLTFATIAGFLPGIFFASIAGVYVDRNKKRRVMILADGVIALSSVILIFAFISYTTPPIWLIYIVLFIRGTGTVFHGISMQAAIPLFVPENELVKAGGYGQLINGVGNLIGPALGALLLIHTSIEYALLVDVIGAALAITCLMIVKINDPSKKERMVGKETKPNFWGEFKHGISVLKQNKPLWKATPHYVFSGVLIWPVNALVLLLVLSHYGGGEFEASIVEIAAAVGMILGSLLIGLFGKIKRKLAMFSLSIILYGICTSMLGILPAHLFWLMVVFTFIIGLDLPFFSVPIYSFLQESTKPEEIGRVTSLLYTFCYIGNPIGLLLAGPLGDILGVDKLFVYLGLAIMLNGALSFVRIYKSESEYIENRKEQLQY